MATALAQMIQDQIATALALTTKVAVMTFKPQTLSQSTPTRRRDAAV